ncbi:MAG: NADH-quinone oxidoreductase subunit M [Pirellulaceae bacterium]|nr:NADH-quinone oxidoreductase subunit M [Pirellulaceae bacterium]HJN12020.1 NADH-quinone oxidoreductase subunit M [Pirellulaceae bacterium]
MFDEFWLLTLIVFLPALGALILAFVPGGRDELVRYITLAVTIIVLGLTTAGFLFSDSTSFDVARGDMQNTFTVSWIPSFDIEYFMGIDGISFPLIMLTALVSVLAMGASWSITKQVKAYCILFLLLETGMLGVFMALDFFLFYVFWEVMLLPMYFLIGVWGGPRREYAALKFFLYTLVGSVLMLIAILLLYFNSDLRKVAEATHPDPENPNVAVADWESLNISDEAAKRLGYGTNLVYDYVGQVGWLRKGSKQSDMLHVEIRRFGPLEELEHTTADYVAEENRVEISLHDDEDTVDHVVAAVQENARVREVVTALARSDGAREVLAANIYIEPADELPVHTFNLLALAAVGQHTDCFNGKALLGWKTQHWAFLLLFLGFIVKVPSVPFHTWLPDAHVEAPTPISMILAGVLLKMGGYGIIRICYPICPMGGYDFAFIVCTVGVVSMVYGAFAALAQKDFKRMVAYSSVSHMGYVVLGLGVWSAAAPYYNPDYWNMGVQGAMFQMIGHGISSAGMFFMVGVVYDRVHHRNLNEFGGLFSKMPVYTALAIGIFFAGLGLPGLCGFVGEVFVVLSVFRFNVVLAVISAGVVVLTAGYILWAIQRVYLGAEYRGPHEAALVPSTLRENTIAGILLALAIIFGVLPYHTVLQYMDKTIERQVDDLTDWTVRTEHIRQAEESGGEADHSSTALRTDSDDLVAPGSIQADLDRVLPTTPTAVVRPYNRSSID